MKRKIEKVPEFDEIIFENRNKKLRSITISGNDTSPQPVSLFLLGSHSAHSYLRHSPSPRKDTPTSRTNQCELDLSKPVIPEIVPPPELEPPPELIKSIKNLQPKVVTDSFGNYCSLFQSPMLLNPTTQNGKVTDSVVVCRPG